MRSRRALFGIVGMALAACVTFPDDLCSDDVHCREGYWCSPYTGTCELRTEAAADRLAVVSLLEAPSPLTGQRDATFTFDCQLAACTFECSLNEGAFLPCISPLTYEALADGDHRFEVRAVDLRDRPGPALAYRWTVDGRLPVVTIDAGPPDLGNLASVTFEMGCDKEDCALLCRLGTGFEEPCESTVTYEDLPDGRHTFVARGLDAAGNVGAPESWHFEVDTVPPSATLHGGPPPRTVRRSATFSFSCDKADCTFACSLDGADAEPCASPRTYPDLALGPHIVSVIARDAAGNESEPLTWSWVVEPPWASVSAGDHHACAIRADGGLWCWGLNVWGQLGDGTMTDRPAPVQVAGGPWRQVSGGLRHTCAVDEAGGLWCWGAALYEVLGIPWRYGDPDFLPAPQRVGADSDWVSVSAGERGSCALKEDATLWCWGDASRDMDPPAFGQALQEPRRITSDLWQAVSVGGERRTCAIREDGVMWCWRGWAKDEITIRTDWTAVSTGREHTCALAAGTLWCWGSANDDGQVGDGTVGPSPVEPTRIGDDGDWNAAGTGSAHSCASRLGDGRLRCWGRNDEGQLGYETVAPRYPTPRVLDADPGIGWIEVTGGEGHTCAIAEDGSLWCWGVNSRGQVGIGDEDAARVLDPVEVL